MRHWDLARAAKREKVGFWADIGDIFLFFGLAGGARAGLLAAGEESGSSLGAARAAWGFDYGRYFNRLMVL